MSTPALPTIPAKKSEDWFDYMVALDAIARTVTPALAPNIATIPYAATVTPDASAGNVHRLTLSGNVTVAPPLNPSEGQMLMFEFTAVGTGPWTVNLTAGATGFKFGTDITSLPAVPSGTTMRVGVIYRTTTARWEVVTVLSGF